MTDEFEDRRKLTFEQAEGAAPLPSQLKLKEISQQLRATLWNVIYSHLDAATKCPELYGSPYFVPPWSDILRYMHVHRDHRMVDDFNNSPGELIPKIRLIFEHGHYIGVFGWLQFVLRLRICPTLPDQIDVALQRGRAAYRVLERDTIVPIGSDAELETLKRAFADLAVTEFHGARAHLRKAAEELTAGRYPDSVRESIHSVNLSPVHSNLTANCRVRWRSWNGPQISIAV